MYKYPGKTFRLLGVLRLTSRFSGCACSSLSDVHGKLLKRQYMHVIGQNRMFCTDATDVSEISIDKRIYQFMDKWDIEKAVDLVITGKNNTTLSGHAIIHMLEKLGEIGDFENILILETHLQDLKLISDESYFYYLSQAFYNSGVMDEGASYIKKQIENKYDKESFNVAFTLFAVPTLKDFNDSFPLYVDIVNERMKHLDFYPVAVLWKCYILGGDFGQAHELLQEYESEVKSYLPIMMNEICQLKDKVETKVSHEEMLRYLLDCESLRRKRLRILVYRTLLEILYSESRWFDLQTTLMDTKDSGVDLPKDFLQHHVRALKSVLNSEELGLDAALVAELEGWADAPSPDS